MLFRTPEMEENPLWVSIHRRSPGQNLTGGIGALSHRRRYPGGFEGPKGVMPESASVWG